MAIVYHLPVRQSPAAPSPDIARAGMLLSAAGFEPGDAHLFGLPPARTAALASAMAANTRAAAPAREVSRR